MKIAIITAMPEEMRAVLAAVERVEKLRIAGLNACSCYVGGHDILLAESGMGFDNAARAAAALIAEVSPDMLVSAGFCGGISPELQVGDVVVATGLAIVTDGGVDEVAVEIPVACRNFVTRQTAQGARIFGGLFCSTPAIIEKKRLAALLPAGAPYPVVEMESAAIARIAAKSGIPFAAIRSVSDPADEELSFTLDEFCDNKLRIRPHKVVLTCLRKPRIIPQIIRLARNSRVAAGTLTRAVRDFLAML
jgi:adenosylhomocysteine nucleosidase